MVRPARRSKLKAEKGINLPDTRPALSSLTDEDRTHLAFVAEHADLVNVSFVRSRRMLTSCCGSSSGSATPHLDVVLKIETAGGFEYLPALLLEAMRAAGRGRHDRARRPRGRGRLRAARRGAGGDPVAVRGRARAGDLGHPGLESLAKNGLPSRAEVTDAAMGQRAECVMLNKGPHIVDAIRFLDDILARMEEHHDKRTTLLRRLSISDAFNLPIPRDVGRPEATAKAGSERSAP